jgi:(1->4)-alpha-D-glucan 1-alpha-D-glucosylmutase
MRILRFRREHHDLFQRGSYEPLTTGDERDQHVVAFVRRWQEQAVIVAVPRFVYTLMRGEMRPPLGADVWQDSAIIVPEQAGELENVLTRERVHLRDSRLLCSEVFGRFPAAVLELR